MIFIFAPALGSLVLILAIILREQFTFRRSVLMLDKIHVELHTRERNARQYKQWRDAVRARDDYRCIDCGSTMNPQADHIYPYSLYPRLRYMIENGITRCVNAMKRHRHLERE